MSTSYRGITVPTGSDQANVPASFTAFADAVLPVGLVQMFAGTTAPDGWLVCDGTSIPAGTEYDALRSLLGGSVTPDFRARMPAGAGGALGAVGATGGGATSTIDTANLPVHSHTIGHTHATAATGDQSQDHVHTAPGGAFVVGSAGSPAGGLSLSTGGHTVSFTNVQNQGHSHNVDIPAFTGNSGDTGSAVPLDTVSPYRVVNFIIKY